MRPTFVLVRLSLPVFPLPGGPLKFTNLTPSARLGPGVRCRERRRWRFLQLGTVLLRRRAGLCPQEHLRRFCCGGGQGRQSAFSTLPLCFRRLIVPRPQDYKLGDPRLHETTLGPVVSQRSAAAIRAQIAAAGATSIVFSSPFSEALTRLVSSSVAKGAKALIPESHFPEAKEGTPYVAPQVLVDVDHSMDVMSVETFGPVMGIMKVRALRRILQVDYLRRRLLL